MLVRKDQKKTTDKFKNTKGRDKSEGERWEIQKYLDRVKQYKQNRTFQNNEIKFDQQVGGKCKRAN